MYQFSPAQRKVKAANQAWVRPFQPGGGPRYMQIAQQVIDAVKNGILQAGDRLPPQRQLAQKMGVDLTTVTRAYTEIRRAGLLDAYGAGGSYIAANLDPEDRTVDLSMNIPPLLASPAFVQMMQQGLKHVQDLSKEGDLMSYHVGAGQKVDREAAVSWLEPVLGAVHPDRIIICPGAQLAISALILARTRVGDAIAADCQTYPGFLAACATHQREVLAVNADEHGMDPLDLERVCQTHQPRLLYLVPTIQNPTTRTLSAERRQALYDVAARYGLGIIEDDPYWLLAGDAPAPLACLPPVASAPVFYISTLSKCLAPGLRVAYLVLPPAEAAEPILEAMRAMMLMANQSMVSALTYWIRHGQAHTMLARIRQELRARQALAAQILPGTKWAHPYGLHVWLSLPATQDHQRLIDAALEQGLGVASADAFSVAQHSVNAIRISLGGVADRSHLKMALTKLADILSVDSPRKRAVVV